jgi:hypothetical protein
MSFTPNEYTPIIWQYMKDNSPFTDEGIAGLMGNMWSESGCTPYACQPSRPKNICEIYIEKVDNNVITRDQFIHGGCSSTGGYTSTQLGFGLVQWTFTSRKQGFYDHVFPNYPSMDSNSIGNIYLQLEYIIEELTTGSFSSVGSVLSSSNDINICSDIVLEQYENPDVQSEAVHIIRRQNSVDVYNTYSTGTLHITVNSYGNGTARVSNNNPVAGNIITLTCTPNTGEALLDIIARTVGGQSMALDPTMLVQTFTMPNESVIIEVSFTSITPPTPPTPTNKRKGMPIWMYPCLRC